MQALRSLCLVAFALLLAPAFASPAEARVPCVYAEDETFRDASGELMICALAAQRTDAPTGMTVMRRPLYVEGNLSMTQAVAWRGAFGWNATQEGPVSDETRVTYTWIGSQQEFRFDFGVVRAVSWHNATVWQDGEHGPVEGSNDREYRNETAANAATFSDVSLLHDREGTGGHETHNRVVYESAERQHPGGMESRTCRTTANGVGFDCPTVVRIPSLIFLTP